MMNHYLNIPLKCNVSKYIKVYPGKYESKCLKNVQSPGSRKRVIINPPQPYHAVENDNDKFCVKYLQIH